MSRVFLTAEWRHVVMLSYEVPEETLLARVPAGTELDPWNGKTLVSVVGFRFLNTRVFSLPVPWHRDFDEVNLRFYVRSLEDPSRRGVVFVKEVVPRRAISWVARSLYNENYHTHPMRSVIHDDEDERSLSYAFTALGREHVLEVRSRQPWQALTPGSEEEFVAEHYYGYAKQRDGSTLEYRVDHPPWRVANVDDARLDFDVAGLYGEEFAEPLRRSPKSAFLAEGSAISVARPLGVDAPRALSPGTASPGSA